METTLTIFLKDYVGLFLSKFSQELGTLLASRMGKDQQKRPNCKKCRHILSAVDPHSFCCDCRGVCKPTFLCPESFTSGVHRIREEMQEKEHRSNSKDTEHGPSSSTKPKASIQPTLSQWSSSLRQPPRHPCRSRMLLSQTAFWTKKRPPLLPNRLILAIHQLSWTPRQKIRRTHVWYWLLTRTSLLIYRGRS